MNKKLFILIALSVLLLGIFLFFRFSGSGTSALWSLSNGGTWLLPLVAVSALIDSINPCAFSILLLTIAFLFSIGRMRSNVLKIGGAYILGIFLVYILIGLGILQALHLFNTPHFMAKLGSSLLVVLGGINVINEFFPKFPLKLQIPQAAHHKMAEFMEKGSLLFALVLGGLVGLCEFPCTGGPYLMVLGLLHDATTYVTGLGYLLFYNLIFIAPLALILLIATNQSLVDRVRSWQRTERKFMKLGSGIAMIALGIIVFFL
ncbi:MAG: cytochrome c biogenesis protein CcdA [Candidatus Wildermuthbacteria bacterium]|nr:cytochrome c biogenesis protein CcdA [Candidatus Wildermuthbacteria bacterium]